MIGRSENRWRGLLVDLDGTLVDDAGRLHPENARALRELSARGVHVVVATGRSEGGTQHVLEELGIEGPAMVYNGAGLWCPRERRYLEERTLSDETRDAAVDFGVAQGALVVTMRAGEKVAVEPDDDLHRAALVGLEDLRFVEPAELKLERAIRVMVASASYPTSTELASALETQLRRPSYLTHFPLSILAHLRASPMHVCDVQAPCRGKAEGLRWLREQHGVEPHEVVCIGDARNDLEMLASAGLAVAMRNAMPEVLECADRVIGDNNSTAIAELVAELW